MGGPRFVWKWGGKAALAAPLPARAHETSSSCPQPSCSCWLGGHRREVTPGERGDARPELARSRAGLNPGARKAAAPLREPERGLCGAQPAPCSENSREPKRRNNSGEGELGWGGERLVHFI